MSYNHFASYYDLLTKNVEYSRRADYLCSLFSENGIDGGLLLDLACGTGSMSVELSKRGFSVIGVDLSEDMLSVAQNKAYENEQSIMFLCQDMRELDLYGTIDCACCNLDSLNHLEKETDIQTVFDRVSLFMNDGGIFIFDLNTIYKHRQVLGNNAFIYDLGDILCAWQNTLLDDSLTVRIDLDFFVKNNDSLYSRFSESFCEKAYEQSTIIDMLKKADFSLVSQLNELTNDSARETDERIVFIARRNKR